MTNIPSNFDGGKFAAKYNLDITDFRVMADGTLICPSLPNLSGADLSDCLQDQPPTEQIFDKPIRTPALYADDVFVPSREIKDDPDEAFAEAVAESQKAHGEPKSLDLITRSQTQMIKELRKQIIELEKRVKKLEK